MQTLSPLGPRGKSELATLCSTGTAFDGGWRRSWAIEARRCGSDWRTLVNCAEAVLSQLRVVHGVSSSS
jgi:hypothetical protein